MNIYVYVIPFAYLFSFLFFILNVRSFLSFFFFFWVFSYQSLLMLHGHHHQQSCCHGNRSFSSQLQRSKQETPAECLQNITEKQRFTMSIKQKTTTLDYLNLDPFNEAKVSAFPSGIFAEIRMFLWVLLYTFVIPLNIFLV